MSKQFATLGDVIKHYEPLYKELRDRQQQEQSSFNSSHNIVESFFDGSSDALRVRQHNEFLALVEQEEVDKAAVFAMRTATPADDGGEG